MYLWFNLEYSKLNIRVYIYTHTWIYIYIYRYIQYILICGKLVTSDCWCSSRIKQIRSGIARLTLNHSGCKQNASPQWLSPAIPSLQRGKSGYLSPKCKCYQAFICVILCQIVCSIVQLLCFKNSLPFAAKSKGRSLVDSCLCGKWCS